MAAGGSTTGATGGSSSASSTAFVTYLLRHAQVTAYHCSRQIREHGYVLEPRTMRDWNFIYLIEGAVTWVVGGTPTTLAPGDLVVVPPGVPHHAHGPGRIRIGSLHLTAALPGGRDLFEAVSAPPLLSVPPGARLDLLLRLAADEFDRDPQPSQMPAWCALVLREWLLANAAAGRLDRAIDPLVAELLAFLEQHLAEDLTLADLAQRAGFTPQHLNRLFRRHLGATPLQIHGDLRLRHAAVLLAEGTRTVKAVAAQVGYADAAYFSRLFTARFGRTPKEVQSGRGAPG